MTSESKGIPAIISLLVEQKKEAEKKLIEVERNIEKGKREARSLREGIKEIEKTIAFINKSQAKEGQDSLQDEAKSTGVKHPIIISDKILELSLGEIGLATRTINSLKWHDIVSVGQLIALTPGLLLKVKGIGQKAISQIGKSLEKLGLSLCKD